MDVATLHTAIRSLTCRGTVEGVQLGATERAALRALRRRLRAVGRRMDRLAPPSGSLIWLVPPRPPGAPPLNSVP